jgi:hypothetical protein
MTQNTGFGSGSAAPITSGQTVSNGILPHAMKKVGTANAGIFSYDQNGNVVGGLDRAFAWDGENRPLSVTKDTSSTQAVTAYAYGPDGERVRKTVTVGTAAPKKTTYVGSDYEVADDGTIPMLPHPDARLVNAPAGTVSTCFVHRDHLASVRWRRARTRVRWRCASAERPVATTRSPPTPYRAAGGCPRLGHKRWQCPRGKRRGGHQLPP